MKVIDAALIAVVVWWTSNTIAHYFIHRPFFRSTATNRCFGLAMTALVGIPQRLWRDRHLAHHAGAAPRVRVSGELVAQIALVGALWTVLASHAPAFFATVYVPGYLCGLALCALHGHFEHAGGTTSHYGRIYHVLLFNDGYHVEHHAHPGVSWRRLRQLRDPAARASVWPPPLRWIELVSPVILDALERAVIRSPRLQRFVLSSHERALGDLLAMIPAVERVAIVGGGLFPRTALVLRKLLPQARLTVIDRNAANLERVREWLDESAAHLVHRRYSAVDPDRDHDVVVIPLAFDGDRAAIYARPPARAVIVHDWVWRRRGASRIVSLLLLKRVNLIVR